MSAETNVITTIRTSMGYTVEELSLTCGLSVGEITEMERDDEVDIPRLRRILSALRISESDLPTVFVLASS
ncbi:helix-turn-helix transcriptional regulator [Mesorhizobium sp. BAC0120]|uniref:helix-turn-helix transcriptional regulator n=1 Tax=Mesorhizobium sp. BAC0120 TaxID=3090670 RepID=UPI00298C1873|nr:helix-turn-helix transcriptional regulator [Mesorhizobium sp. BAC0120]MDW6026344.1 helix-turn-helix transcriptional regulator [Mesorhizobium sp. BAC0120]